MKKTDLAWAAGLIDGEGCVHISKTKPPKSKDWSPKYNLNISVGMTDKETIDRLYDLFGGTYQYRDLGNLKKNWKNQYRWRMNDKQCGELLRLLRPFIFTKRKQWELAEEFLKVPVSQRGYKVPKEIIEKREVLYTAMKALNRKGIK